MTSPRLHCVVASIRRGLVLQEPSDDALSPMMHELAATLPEMLGSPESGSIERVAALMDPEARSEGFTEVLLLSQSHIHVVKPLPTRSGEALLASAPAGRSVGLVLSQVHARAAELESEP
ncbi:MAG: hypothetical protein K0R38_4459 [Polyangiaceae bacterium]|nr:hypothetical protein [Polyangiaceae bacterium]